MRNLSKAFMVAAFLLFPTLATGTIATAASEKVLSLTLDGDLLGASEVLLGSKGMKIRNHLGMAFWFPDKPSSIFLLNPENQTYFAQPASEYVDDLRKDFSPLKYTRLKRQPKTLADGTKAEMVTVFNTGTDGKESIVAEITCLKNKSLPPGVHRIWCSIMGLPEEEFGLPIGAFQNVRRFRHAREAFNGGGRQRWKCAAIPKKVMTKTVDDKLLKLPSNYRQARDKASLFLSTDGNLQQKDLEDFFISTPRKKK